MIFTIGLLLFLFAMASALVLSLMGRLETGVKRQSDLIVAVPLVLGPFLMFVSICMWLWKTLP